MSTKLYLQTATFMQTSYQELAMQFECNVQPYFLGKKCHPPGMDPDKC